MEPVRVKAYGLVPITKSTYLAIQAVGAVVLALCYLGADLLPVPQAYRTYWRWFIVFIALAEVVETSVMLWKFRQAEHAAREQSRGDDPHPPHA